MLIFCANSNWPKSNWPKSATGSTRKSQDWPESNWPKSSILVGPEHVFRCCRVALFAQRSGWSRCPHGDQRLEIVHSVALHAQETPWHAKVGKDELCRRFDKFIAGEWADLIRDGLQACAQEGHATHHGLDSVERRAVAACQKIRLGEISRAR